jgi:hypothetical protein
MRGAGVEHASRETCKTRRKDASTKQPKNRATLLAFSEISYEGGLGEVASAAVIGWLMLIARTSHLFQSPPGDSNDISRGFTLFLKKLQ